MTNVVQQKRLQSDSLPLKTGDSPEHRVHSRWRIAVCPRYRCDGTGTMEHIGPFRRLGTKPQPAKFSSKSVHSHLVGRGCGAGHQRSVL